LRPELDGLLGRLANEVGIDLVAGQLDAIFRLIGDAGLRLAASSAFPHLSALSIVPTPSKGASVRD